MPILPRIRPSFDGLPISIRLTLWYGLTLVILLSMFAGYSYLAFHESLHKDFDQHLTHEQRGLMPFVQIDAESLKFEETLRDIHSVATQTEGIYGTYVRLISPSGEEQYRSPNLAGHASLEIQLPVDPEETTISRNWEDKPARTRYAPLLGNEDLLVGWLEITGFEWTLHQQLRRFGRAMVLGIIFGVLPAIGGGYLLASRALRPVASIIETADRFGATDLSLRLPIRTRPDDELSALSRTMNRMLSRLEASFERERRFTSNAAHELLTPLTTMRSGVEVALTKERDSTEYQRVLNDAVVEIAEMSTTINGLLLLSRVDLLQETPRTRVDLSEQLKLYIDRYLPLAADKRLRMRSEIASDVYCSTDEQYVGHIIENLLDNALKYTPEGGQVFVRLEKAGNSATLSVTDDGIGFDQETATRLFDRFYRSDAAEVQSQNGSGLGLALVDAIVKIYGGEVSAQSEGSSKGSRFVVKLPLV